MDKSRIPVLVSALRTPVGRGRKGTLAHTRPDDLAALVRQFVNLCARWPREGEPAP